MKFHHFAPPLWKNSLLTRPQEKIFATPMSRAHPTCAAVSNCALVFMKNSASLCLSEFVSVATHNAYLCAFINNCRSVTAHKKKNACNMNVLLSFAARVY